MRGVVSTLLAAAVAGLSLAIPGSSAAQSQEAGRTSESAGELTGTVVALDGDDLVLDLGEGRVTSGAKVEIWRPLRVKHPITGKVLVDRFRIGWLEVGQVRKSLSLARPDGELARPPERGDVVIVVVVVPAPPVPGASRHPGAPASTAVVEPGDPYLPAPVVDDPEARAVVGLFDGLRGANVGTRIRKYEDYGRGHPNGRFTRVLLEEAGSLRKLFELQERAPSRVPDVGPVTLSFAAPTEVREGAAFGLAIELDNTNTGALLHVRQAGESVYTSHPMVALGGGYFSAAVPRERVRAPALEYFIEAATPAGVAVAVVGAPNGPSRIDVAKAPPPERPKQLVRTASLSTDYADYNRWRGNDRVWQTEGFVGLRLGDTGVRAVRSGFGVYRGIGGAIAELDDQGKDGRAVGLTYGYLEGEFGIVPVLAIIARAAVGLLDDGVSGGGQLLLRIGSDRGTNLLVGGELLGGVGLRSIAQIELATFERFPMLLRTEVTNQPAGSHGWTTPAGTAQGSGEIGVRGIAQLGYRVFRPLTVAARGSFQGRTINHAGPGFGAGVSYEW